MSRLRFMWRDPDWVFENCDRIGTHDHTASSLWEVIGWWLDQRETECRCSKRLRQGYGEASVVSRRPECGDVWRHLSCGRCRTHGESGLGEGDNESRFCRYFLGRDFSSYCHRRRTLGHHGGRTPRPAAILGREDCVRGSTRCPGSSCECLAACLFSYRFRSWQRDVHHATADGHSVAISERQAPSRKLTTPAIVVGIVFLKNDVTEFLR